MSNSFFIVLPSNSSYAENQPNKFLVRLPRKVEFDGNWMCGLHSVVYPNTWAGIGTTTQQYMEIYLKDGRMFRVLIPRSDFTTPLELERNLQSGIVRELTKLFGLDSIQRTSSIKTTRVKRKVEEEEILREN
jgi:hypothetical protein